MWGFNQMQTRSLPVRKILNLILHALYNYKVGLIQSFIFQIIPRGVIQENMVIPESWKEQGEIVGGEFGEISLNIFLIHDKTKDRAEQKKR